MGGFFQQGEKHNPLIRAVYGCGAIDTKACRAVITEMTTKDTFHTIAANIKQGESIIRIAPIAQTTARTGCFAMSASTSVIPPRFQSRSVIPVLIPKEVS